MNKFSVDELTINHKWISLTNLHVTVPLSELSFDPWGEEPEVSAYFGNTQPLELRKLSQDTYEIDLPEPGGVEVFVNHGGFEYSEKIEPLLEITTTEQNELGHPIFEIKTKRNANMWYRLKDTESGENLNFRKILPGLTKISEPLSFEEWLELSSDRVFALQVLLEDGSHVFHEETFTIEPAPVSKYKPTIRSSEAQFVEGRQNLTFKLRGLHLDYRSVPGRLEWTDGETQRVEITEGVFSYTVPFRFSDASPILFIDNYDNEVRLPSYTSFQDHGCKIEQLQSKVTFSSSSLESSLIDLDVFGLWHGSVAVQISGNTKDIEPIVMFDEKIDLERENNSSSVSLTLAWIIHKIHNARQRIVSENISQELLLTIQIYCGGNATDASKLYSIVIPKLNRSISMKHRLIENKIYLEEGSTGPHEVHFSYDPLHFENNPKFSFTFRDVTLPGKCTEGNLSFVFPTEQIARLVESDTWELKHRNEVMSSGEFFIPTIRISKPNIPAEIVVSTDRQTISLPEYLCDVTAEKLPASTKMNLHIDLDSADKELIVPSRFRKSSPPVIAEESNHETEKVLFSLFLGTNKKKRENAWLKQIGNSSEGKIGDYWVSFPTRAYETDTQRYPLKLKIDDSANIHAALVFLSHQKQVDDRDTITQFLDSCEHYLDELKQIFSVFIKHVFHGETWIKNDLSKLYKGIGNKRSASILYGYSARLMKEMKTEGLFLKELFSDACTYGQQFISFISDASNYFQIDTDLTYNEVAEMWRLRRG